MRRPTTGSSDHGSDERVADKADQRAVYLHEIHDAERKAKSRARMEARYGSALEALDRSSRQQAPAATDAEVVDMRDVRSEAQ